MYKIYVSDVEKSMGKIYELPLSVRSHILSYKNNDMMMESYTAYLLLDEALKENGIDTYNISFDGKPYLDINLHFNISHDSGRAVVVISNEEIGVDIMKIRPFNNKTYEYIKNENEKVTDDYSYTKLWTMKEAYIKYMGGSISSKMNLIDTTKYNYDIFDKDNFIIAVCKGELK